MGIIMKKCRLRKIVSYTVLFTVMIFLSGCADKEVKTEVQTEVVQTPTEGSEPKPAVETEEEEQECMQLWKEEYHRPLKGEDAEILQLRGNLELCMEKDAYPELRESLRQYSEQARSYAENSSCRVIVHRADKRALSFLECKNEGADLQGYSFDPETGKRIELSEVVNDMDKLAVIVDDQLKSKYPDVSFSDDLKEKITSSWNEVEKMTWTVSYHGICLYFFPGTLAQKENGMFYATVLFSDVPELFTEKYMQIPAAYAIELEDNIPFSYDMDLDGAADDVRIFHFPEEEESTGVRINDKECRGKYDDWHYFSKANRTYLLHTAQGNNYIAFYERGDLDGSGVYGLYGMEQDNVIYLGCEEKDVYLHDNRITDLDFVNTVHSGDPLLWEFGWCDAEYFITEQGFWEVKDPVFYYRKLNWEMKTLSELTLPAVDPYTGEALGTDVIIPENTYMELLRTDGILWSDFLLKDGTVCRMTFDEREELWDMVTYQGKKVDGEWLHITQYVD